MGFPKALAFRVQGYLFAGPYHKDRGFLFWKLPYHTNNRESKRTENGRWNGTWVM